MRRARKTCPRGFLEVHRTSGCSAKKSENAVRELCQKILHTEVLRFFIVVYLFVFYGYLCVGAYFAAGAFRGSVLQIVRLNKELKK